MRTVLFALLISCLSLSSTVMLAQPVFGSMISDPQIHSVEFSPSQNPGAFPIIFIGAQGTLTLHFDEFLDPNLQQSRFYADIFHCDADWNKDFLIPLEFYNGFANRPIEDWRRSEFTITPYVHYSYTFPQENEGFKVSGNYVLKVYRIDDPSKEVITRRFVVLDNKLRLDPVNQLSNRLNRQRFNNYSFAMYTQGMQVYDPMLDFKLVIMQNYRWDQTAVLTRPTFQTNQRFEYQLDLSQLFPRSGSEFRWLDLRSTRLWGIMVQEVEESPEGVNFYLFPDKIRKSNEFGQTRDYNGGYWIQVQEWQDFDVQADYGYVHFFLEASSPFSKDVYIAGKFNDWQVGSNNRMAYNKALGRYEGQALIKQGVYDYTYGLASGSGMPLDETDIQGTPGLAENYYTVLVYYKRPGDRTHQLVGYLPVNYQD